MNALQVFSYTDQPVRVINVNGDPFFVGKDVATILGYRDTSDALKKHVDEEDKRVGELPTPGGMQKVITINESGLYSLILRSQLLTARQFKHWVTSEVLPSIQKQSGGDSPDDRKGGRRMKAFICSPFAGDTVRNILRAQG